MMTREVLLSRLGSPPLLLLVLLEADTLTEEDLVDVLGLGLGGTMASRGRSDVHPCGGGISWMFGW